ncbi:MAG: 2-C-methyl-D-erythritol 4-phosphate cytidylyltransferase [Microbacterium sp.]|nr:MAG: 2-C-methyl-D-erythritol 4-phosphate cytidylyltransferase [Microbacterium sp.]
MTDTPLPRPRTAIIVVAAGSGTRLAAGAPKAFVGIDDHSVLRHALRGVFATAPAQVVVVVPADRTGDALTEVLEAAGDRRDLVSVVAGGETRQQSVAAGLAAMWPDVEFVLVHDAARALTPPEVFDRVVAALAAGHEAVLPVLPVVDTVKQVDGQSVVAAVDRSVLAAAQTPQGFRRDVLLSALATAEEDHTVAPAACTSAASSV